ncbi:T9SS type A sorting domain-containing protein [Lunatimonas salinarum]|uniref:T9SS type A sorting domain-containing protein n=1 Tax=Lunatimonas salinarum TaxID=1774590 RepID=UPI001AE09D2D|nr:T9SS type A sorting domain-containing protein [Lunatimonas salinarum]
MSIAALIHWTVFKDGVILGGGFGKNFYYIFDDVGHYQVQVAANSFFLGGNNGSASVNVNSRVKIPNPITGPTVCSTEQSYSFFSNPSLPGDDPDCTYHYSYLWTAPSGWDINGNGNTAFTGNPVNITAPLGTPSGNYEISVQSSIHYGGIPIQDNSWFSTRRTYSVRVGSFNSSEVSVSGTVAACGGNTYTYTANTAGGHKNGYSYNWTYPSGWVVQYSSDNIIQLYVPTTYSSYGTVRVSIDNGCGSPSPYTGLTVFPCNYMGSGDFLIYPNPAEGELNIEYYDMNETAHFHTLNAEDESRNNDSTEVYFQIELYNKQEELVQSGVSKSGKIKLNTNNFQPGIYFLRIHSGKEVYRKRVLIK